MRRKNNGSRKKYILTALGSAAVLGAAGCIVLGTGLPSAEAVESGQSTPQIIVNQGLGLGLDGESGEFYLMDTLVADRNTGFFVQIAPQIWQELDSQPVLLVSDGTVTWSFADSEYWEEYELLCFDTAGQMTWDAGQYDIRVDLEQGGILEREVVFCSMQDLKILIVPIEGYYSGEVRQTGALGDHLWEYTEKVCPVGADDLQWTVWEDDSVAFDSSRYDLDTSLGRLRTWQQLKVLLDQGTADMVIGIVPENMKQRAAAEEATVTGFTFGDNVSVISLRDSCPQATVAHEIGHCLSLGDEYENGTFSVSMNMVPYGMKGKNRYRLSETVQGTNPYIIGGTADEWQGSGTVVYARQYPYDVLSGEILFRDMTSFMGLSGYLEQEYWVTTQIWESLYKEFQRPDP